MEFPPTTRRQVREWLNLATDPDISAAHEEDEMYRERAEIDQIMAEVDRELVAEAHTETRRVGHDFVDGRRARRAARRAEHAAVRSLPVRLDITQAVELGGEAA